MKTYIKGKFSKYIYRSDKGYVIGLFKVKETTDEHVNNYVNKTITFTGTFSDLNEDDSYLFYGEAVTHPRYGFQYQVSEYERIKPEDKDGIVAFLSSSLFPGVGEKQAEKIVDTLGENTLDLILEDVNNLLLVPKMTMKKANKIYDILTKYEESHKTIVYLTDLGFNMKDALEIYNYYRAHTINVIEHNIYSILDDIEEMSFPKVDEVAKKLNFTIDDERRIKACVIYIIKALNFNNGDTYLYHEEILNGVENYLKIDLSSDEFDFILEALIDEEKIYIDGEKYYLKEVYDMEENIASKIKFLINKSTKIIKNLDSKIASLEKDNNILYNEEQKKAIKAALENNIVIITGGPGTGKTTIIKAIVELYMSINKQSFNELTNDLALLAPTGRAAKRMSESTSLPATTIHRFLKWNKENNQFGINEYNKDLHKVIIIDEVSMIDVSLLDALFKGLTNNIKLILVGDYNQLPSVGPGQILKDLIESDVINTINLEYLYRQDENSYITTLAQEIKNDELSETFTEPKGDYQFLECPGYMIRNSLKALCQKISDKGYTYKDVQIMAPMYRGENGIDNLNVELQNVFNPKDPSKKEIIIGDVTFRENDKVLQLVNIPDENVYNGDVGIIKEIVPANISPNKRNELYIDFDGNIINYAPKDFNKIKHGFAISIHKSQGSEFDIVVMPMCNAYKRMLYRKLIYTGITRAKKKLILLGEANSFIYGIDNNNENTRKTSLKEKLINECIK